MLNVLLIVLGVVALAVILFFLARNRNSPCPASLTWLLENPYMNHFAGSEKLLDRAGVQPGMHVLDAGCGPGRITLPASRRVGPDGRVTAFDIQEKMLAKLQKRIDEQNATNVETMLGGLGQGLLPENTFDRAFLVTVLGEIPDQLAALKEIRGALKEECILSITEMLPDPDYLTKKRLTDLAQQAGFTVHDVIGGWLAYTMNLKK